MANLNVTYDEMRDSAARLRQGRDDMQGKLAELGALIDNLVSSGFQTDAASGSYNDQFNQFETGTRQAIDALEGLAGFLESAAQALQTTDSDLSSAIKG